MLKQQAILEVKRGERLYQLSLYSDSSLGEVFDVISEMRSFIVQKMVDAQNADKPKAEDKEE